MTAPVEASASAQHAVGTAVVNTRRSTVSVRTLPVEQRSWFLCLLAPPEDTRARGVIARVRLFVGKVLRCVITVSASQAAHQVFSREGW